jgi:hypothetical protein
VGRFDFRGDPIFRANGSRPIVTNRLMHLVAIAVLPKVLKFSLEVLSVPEQGVIEVSATNCPNPVDLH